MRYTYKYPHPAVTADAVVIGFGGGELSVLLIQRRAAPYKSYWAFPGGFVEIDEDPGVAVQRELQEETGITGIGFEQLGAFGAPHRDPRERVISVAYLGLTNIANHVAREADDAKAVAWFPVRKLPRLAFDHRDILRSALLRLRIKARFEPIGLRLLPALFSWAEIQALYDAILGRTLDTATFRRKLLRTGVVVAARSARTRPTERSGRLYRFDRRACRRATLAGFVLV